MHTPDFIPPAARIRTANLSTLFVTALATLALVACGGGDGDTSATGSSSGASASSIPIQTTVLEPPLVVGTARRLALDYLNRQRLHCGFGALRYSTVLEEAGTAHANYTLLNAKSPLFHPHTEVSGLPGFTAPSPTERAIRRGYKTNGTEVGEIGVAPALYSASVESYNAAPLHLIETEGMRGLSVAPYHAMHFLGAYTEVGVGVVRQETRGPAQTTYFGNVPVLRPESIELNYSMFVMLGYAMDQLGQLPPAGTGVRTYPCEGSTDVPPLLMGEWTDPALGPGVTPGRELGINPTGTTIMVIGEVGKTLALQSVTLTRVLTGEKVPMYSIRTRANDPMAVYYRNDWTGYAMPDKALEPNERYRVQVTGTSGGAPFSRSFTYTTGARSVF